MSVSNNSFSAEKISNPRSYARENRTVARAWHGINHGRSICRRRICCAICNFWCEEDVSEDTGDSAPASALATAGAEEFVFSLHSQKLLQIFAQIIRRHSDGKAIETS